MISQRIRSDYRRYRATGRQQGSLLGVVLSCQGFWASSGYRVAATLVRTEAPLLRTFARLLALIIRKLHEVVAGICLPAECEIGSGLYIGHYGSVIVHPRARLGSNCNLSQGVTIGAKQSGAKVGAPSLGDRVYVGPNAVIVGAVSIGDDVVIGAGAVVVEDVPDRGVVVGNPARIVSRRGSFELVAYDCMVEDPGRMASLAARDLEAEGP